MTARKISQQQARQLRKRAEEAEQKLRQLVTRGLQTYGGVEVGSVISMPSDTMASLRTARRLNYALYAIPREDSLSVSFRAIKPGEF